MTPGLQIANALLASSATSARRAGEWLLARQHQPGYWWADLSADTTLEADYILLELFLHPPSGGVWNPWDRRRIDRAVRSILARQLPDGGFNTYPGGSADVSASVKAYFSLKVAGVPADAPTLVAARERIRSLGGIEAANSYVKLNLSLFGLFPRQYVPSIPPEIVLAGNIIYQMSSWTRAIVVPLSIVHALNPQRPVPDGFNLNELFLTPGATPFRRDRAWITWRNFFLALDRGFKLWERFGSRRIRQKAIRSAERWMVERTRYSDGLGAIYPPMMYACMVFDLLGYPEDHPDRMEANRQFENLLVDDGERFFFQPCFSPVWDTAIAAHALGEAGAAPAEAMGRCADWLLSKEVRRAGDWSVKRPGVEPSGWYFEFANEFYPDIDDTAMVLLALRHAKASRPSSHDACVNRAVNWLLAMQSRDGGWAAFDVDNNWQVLADVPFADHNAMLDPTCPDITGRVMEGLVASGVQRSHPAIRRGVEYLIRTQEPDGSWYGRWGVNYIYGTFLALRGLRTAGESDREAHMLRAGEWLRSIQNADGGWGESCASYDSGGYVAAPSTPSQTAWAILGLLASGDTTSHGLHKGIEHLIDTQKLDGSWDEELATGTGFPRVFYLCYHYYRISFPLLALAEYVRSQGNPASASGVTSLKGASE